MPIVIDALPRASNVLLNYVLAELGACDPRLVGGGTGLPAGALECLDQNLVIVPTPITTPMFHDALVQFAHSRKRDVVLVRHGFAPETLDAVRVDVALRSTATPILLADLSFWRGLDDSLHLVPSGHELFIAINAHGLDVSLVSPWNTIGERSAGLERAAAEIVRACGRQQRV